MPRWCIRRLWILVLCHNMSEHCSIVHSVVVINLSRNKNGLWLTGIIVLLQSPGKNLERATELLSSEIGMEGEENLDNFDELVGMFCNCTHLV